MKMVRAQYRSPDGALAAVARRLSLYEDRYRMTSEDFFNGYEKGRMEDAADFVEWANDYQHCPAVSLEEIEKQMRHPCEKPSMPQVIEEVRLYLEQ